MLRSTNSIFATIRQMLGSPEGVFDMEILTDINSVFLNLYQLGVGPSTPFQITGEEETWDDFAKADEYPGLPSYIYLKTKLLFDIPQSSFVINAMQNQIAEFEWRLKTQAEHLKDKDKPAEPEEPPTTEPENPDEPTTPPETEEQAVRRLFGEKAYTKRVIRRNQNGRSR